MSLVVKILVFQSVGITKNAQKEGLTTIITFNTRRKACSKLGIRCHTKGLNNLLLILNVDIQTSEFCIEVGDGSRDK